MSHVARLELLNWGPFRGPHAVDLEPEVYAVVGRRDGDEESSNGCGKSNLLGALRFALFGERPPEHRLEDDWITRGEPEGRVCVEMSDGLRVERGRARGSSTKLKVTLPMAASAGSGKHAADALAAYLRMSAQDFAAGPWVGQADVARMVLATPGQRAELVEGWLQLGQLRAAEKDAQQRSRTSDEEYALHGVDLDGLLGRLAELQPMADAERADLQAQQREAAEQVQGLGVRLEVEAGRRARAAAADVTAARRSALENRVRELAAPLVHRQAGDVPALEASSQAAGQAYADARREAERLRALVHGDGFDGQCPVTCDACPVAADVQHRGRQLGDNARAAAETSLQRQQEARDAAAALTAVRASQQAEQDRLQRLRSAQEELRAMPVAAGQDVPVEDAAALRSARDEWAQRERELSNELAVADRDASLAADLRRQVEQKQAQLAELGAEARRWAEAAAIIRGARREVAELAVGSVEHGANKSLLLCGAGLTVRFRWEREGQGLAGSCDRCGAAYPSKQSVKTCGRCGADRAAKVVEALELVPSMRSGGCDDLAGLFTQLSAAAWLRAKRESPLGLVVVDEPFAHLDPVNARALGQHLHRALRAGLGFEQAFCVAHTAAVTESMPRRLVVRAGAGGSRLEVE